MSAAFLENRTFDEIAVGESASLSRKFTKQDTELFALLSGDVNPGTGGGAAAKTGIFHKAAAHGLLSGGLIASVVDTKLPGPGSTYLEQDLEFLKPVGVGDTITATLTVTEKRLDTGEIVLDLPLPQSEWRAGGAGLRTGAGVTRADPGAAHGIAGHPAQPA